MEHLTDKEFFKQIKKIGGHYSEKIELQFAYFCLEIFPELDLSEEDIENALEGFETNDDGIDAFHIDHENDLIYFFQFKSTTSEKGFKLNTLKKDTLDYLYNIPKRLENQDYTNKHKNFKIQEIVSPYLKAKEEGFNEKFEYYHLGRNPNPAIETSYPKLKYHGYEAIKNEYLEYYSKLDVTEPDSIDIQLYDNQIEKKIGNNKHTFISLITGDELINLRDKYKYKLFDKNLRFSLGKNKINTAIIKTALEDPENFYFFNNGITIMSSEFKFKETNQKITIKHPQIINGAQTVNAIYDAHKQYKKEEEEKEKHFKKILILFRIIQKKSDSAFEMNVTHYNNSQNAIQARDFYANAKEQIDLQKKFAAHGFFYEIKRGDRLYIKKNKHNLLKKKLSDFEYKDEGISIIKLAGLWMAYKVQRPDLKSVGKNDIFGNEKKYKKLFKPENLTDKLIEEMIFAYFVFTIIEKEAKIYRGIDSILTLIEKDNFYQNNETFKKANDKVRNSLVYNKIIKDRFSKYKEETGEDRKKTLEAIRSSQPLSSAKYLVTALIKAIIDKCNYLDKIIEYKLFKDKRFIQNKIIGAWLSTILQKLIIPDYKDTISTKPSINYYWMNNVTYDRIKDKFNGLDIDEDEEFHKIFPLDFNNLNK